jgi:hypothetical protein
VTQTKDPGPPDPAVVAIAVAVQRCWPRAEAPPEGPGAESLSAWRLSGRWWSAPVVLRRQRPWARSPR